MNITVRRETLGPAASAGTLWVDGNYFGVTLELPWKENRPQISCIPEGAYPLGITYSVRFGYHMILVRDVPNRAGIRIHNANRPSELRGCIAVAKNRLAPDHIQDGLSKTLKVEVEGALSRGERVTLTIKNPAVKA